MCDSFCAEAAVLLLLYCSSKSGMLVYIAVEARFGECAEGSPSPVPMLHFVRLAGSLTGIMASVAEAIM